jgi:hypothetical protein
MIRRIRHKHWGCRRKPMDRRFATIKGLGGPIILQRFNWLKLPLSVRRTSHRHGWLSYPSVPRFYTPNPLHNATPYSLPPRGDNSSGEVDWEYELIFENLSSCCLIRVLLKIPVFPCLIFFFPSLVACGTYSPWTKKNTIAMTLSWPRWAISLS